MSWALQAGDKALESTPTPSKPLHTAASHPQNADSFTAPIPAVHRPVCCVAPQGLWLAGAIGLSMTLLLSTQCPRIFAAMGAAPEVVGPAVAYMRARCLASPAILGYYVLSGTFRGFKDTR